jgi:hypothetical protein
MEMTYSSEMLVGYQWTTGCHIPEDSTLCLIFVASLNLTFLITRQLLPAMFTNCQAVLHELNILLETSLSMEMKQIVMHSISILLPFFKYIYELHAMGVHNSIVG